MKLSLLPLLCVLLVVPAVSPMRADVPKSPRPQTLCPLTGDVINRRFYVDYNGKRIYVCCPHCIKKVKDNPKKYIRQLESEGITLEMTPKDANTEHAGY